MQDLFVLIVREADVLELDVTDDAGEDNRSLRIDILGVLVQDFARTLQAGQRFCNLSPNRHHLQHWGYQEAHEHRVHKEAANRQTSGENLPCSEIHHYSAHDPEQHGRGETHD